MTVLNFDIGDLFIIRTIKHLATNPDQKWANSYEVRADNAGDGGMLLTLASAIVLFESTMSLQTVRFDRSLISTWQPDSRPYNPATFMSIPLTASGAAAAATDPLPLSQCLSVARVPLSGRFGHIFYRGWLKEGDVSAPAGKPILVDPAALQGTVQAALDTSELASYFGLDNRSGLSLVMVEANGEDWRNINDLVVQGVSQLPTDHAWFNRTPAP